MSRHQGPILVDTNVIIECHRTDTWPALVGGYSVETVEDCVIETQTGLQKRRPQHRIDVRELRKSLNGIHAVGGRQRTELVKGISDIGIDRGEASLWAHAIHREDDWLFCGPDSASLRSGIRLGFREQLISLERLLIDVGHRPTRSSKKLREAYTESWQEKKIGQLILIEEGGL